jgi:energy-coupling factor transport system permease protein
VLKDITLGQFYPGETLVHKLDPRTKLILTLVFIVALFTAALYVGYGLVILFLVYSIAVSRIKLKTILSGLKPLVIIVLITGILNLFYTRGEHLLVHFWRISIYWEGVETAVFMALRIMFLITGTLLLTYTTSPLQLTDGLESLLGPLKKLRLPVHELAMMMSIALRFIPTLIEETDKIMSAQRARGADFESGGLIAKAKAMLPLLIPLFVSAFRRADELATAMESRCYHGGEGRTRMKQLRMERRDWIALAVGALLLAAVILCRRLGL